MKKKLFFFATSVLSLIGATGCKDQFADINNDQSKVKGDIRYAFTDALINMDPFDYASWFYNNRNYYMIWNQTLASSSGNGENLNRMGELFDPPAQLVKSKYQVEAVRYMISKLPANEAATYTNISAICNPILVYLGIFGTDNYGSLAYTEAAKAQFTEPALLTPKYETQEELFDIWEKQLNETIKTLTNPVLDSQGKESPQVSLGNQDFVYKGNLAKWAKFTNSLKLKLAVRLLHVDKARALRMAEEVASSPAGVMDGLSDDFIWNPSVNFFHFGDAVSFGAGSYQLIDFLVKNKDPRVRFLFRKNDFNAEITAGFVANGKKLPSYIEKYINYKTDDKGNKVFDGWKAPGEPWVRYHGVPVDIKASLNPIYQQEYYTDNNFKLKMDDKEKQYNPVSLFQEELIRGQKDFSYPALPNKNPINDNQDQPYFAAYLSTAEVNLYLAEFKLLGANLPGSAESYYNKAIEMSVRLYDRLASLNKIPYYGDNVPGVTTTDPSIDLKNGEIENLMTQSSYVLSGSVSEQLEKVYLQMYLHFIYSPNDQFVTVRRSGVPMKGSKIYPWVSFDSQDEGYIVPRRLKTPALNPTDQMYEIKSKAFKEEGFTPGSVEPKVLSSERVWYDKNAPAYGAGPNLK